MPSYVVRQPDGGLAVFSTVVDDFTACDMSAAECVEYWLHKGLSLEDAAEKVRRGVEDVDLDVYSRPASERHKEGRWEDALVTILHVHGWRTCCERMRQMGGVNDEEIARLRGCEIQLGALRPKLQDCESALKESEARRDRLLAAIREHWAQRADDRCLEDDDRLYDAAGLPACDRRVGDRAAMLDNCRRFIERRCEGGGPWKSYAELEADLAEANRRLNLTYCAYCGYEVASDADASLITEHVRSCEKHPMRALEAENATLRRVVCPDEPLLLPAGTHYGDTSVIPHPWAVEYFASSLLHFIDGTDTDSFITCRVNTERGPVEVTIQPHWLDPSTPSDELAHLTRENERLHELVTALKPPPDLIEENDRLRDRVAFLEETTRTLRGPGGVVDCLDGREGGG